MDTTQTNNNLKCIDGFGLKLIAIITMLIDHTGAVLFPQYLFLRIIGRLAFPIFCFLIVEGFQHTKNIKVYLSRLFLFALISEIPFDLAFNSSIDFLHDTNVFFTLGFGLLVIYSVDSIKKITDNKYGKLFIYIPTIAISYYLAYYLQTDYSIGGVTLILIIYLFKNRSLPRFVIATVSLYLFFGFIEALGAISFLPIQLYNNKRGPKIKYLFYLFYPCHLLLLWYISKHLLS